MSLHFPKPLYISQNLVKRLQLNIQIDDAIGAVLQALSDKKMLENTIFLFQMDHGIETKMALYENGIRIAQFIHYPLAIPKSSKFHGLVSTIDIAATMLDFAGVSANYVMDGVSWKTAIAEEGGSSWWTQKRCLLAEQDRDRSVRCGCGKLIEIFAANDTNTRAVGVKPANNFPTDDEMYFHMCLDGEASDAGNYVKKLTASTANPEATNMISGATNISPAQLEHFRTAMDCFVQKTSPAAELTRASFDMSKTCSLDGGWEKDSGAEQGENADESSPSVRASACTSIYLMWFFTLFVRVVCR